MAETLTNLPPNGKYIQSVNDSATCGSSSLELLIPNANTPVRLAEVVHERNLKPSKYQSESDLRVSVASKKLNLPELMRYLYDLIFWQRPVATFGTFSAALFLQLGFIKYSVISVLSNTLLVLLLVCSAIQSFFWLIGDSAASPLNSLAKIDLKLSSDTCVEVAKIFTFKLNHTIRVTRDLFLVQNVGSSFKFGLVLYFMTYIGAYFNLLTITIFGTCIAFSLPKFWELHKSDLSKGMTHVMCSGDILIEEICKRTRRFIPDRNVDKF